MQADIASFLALAQTSRSCSWTATGNAESSWLTDTRYLHFWIDDVLKQHLYESDYTPTQRTEIAGSKRTHDSIVEKQFQGELSMNEFTSFYCCTSEIASNAVAYAAAAEEAAIARGEAMTVQAETVAQGAARRRAPNVSPRR